MASNTDDSFNTDELEAPEWLNGDFFTKVFRSCESDNEVQVKNFKISPATVKGDHYASVMFRANVDYQLDGVDKTESLIIKTMPEVEGHKKDMLGESHIFETEIGMYTEVIPKFEEILREAGDHTVLGARCLYYSLSPRKVIVFEDIVPHGYIVLRDRQVNMEEAKAAYLKIAKWHAVSYKIALENPCYFDQYRHSFMTMDAMMENDLIAGGVTNFLSLLESEPTLRKYCAFFEPLEGKLIGMCQASAKEYRDNPQANAAYVLCHGDFHCKNMMFKHSPSTGHVEDVMLLDFQLTYMGPMVNDIIYSIFMLLDTDLRTHNLDELIYYYFTNFLETLKSIGYEGRMPKLTEFREQQVRHRCFNIFLIVTFLPMWYAFRAGQADPDQMMQDHEYRRSFYNNKMYIDELHTILPKYMHLGYFEN